MRFPISPGQCRAGRALPEPPLTVADLARFSGLDPEVIELFEAGEATLTPQQFRALKLGLGEAGVLTKPSSGYGGEIVRLRFPPDHDEPIGRDRVWGAASYRPRRMAHLPLGGGDSE